MEPGSLWLQGPPLVCHAHVGVPSRRRGEHSKPWGDLVAQSQMIRNRSILANLQQMSFVCLICARDVTTTPPSPFSLAPAPQECSSEWKIVGLNRELSSRAPAITLRRSANLPRWLSYHPLPAALRVSPQQPPPPLPTHACARSGDIGKRRLWLYGRWAGVAAGNVASVLGGDRT